MLAGAAAWGYEDGAPPGHTGGFGEPDCTACHSDNEPNAPGGTLEVGGLPARYVPGERYRVAVTLAHPDLEAGGFQLAFRTAAGAPAGRVSALDPRTGTVSAGAQRYVQQTPAGREAARDGRIAWEIEWRAPASGVPVVLHLAANAANDDLSELGDFIYTLERTLEPSD